MHIHGRGWRDSIREYGIVDCIHIVGPVGCHSLKRKEGRTAGLALSQTEQLFFAHCIGKSGPYVGRSMEEVSMMYLVVYSGQHNFDTTQLRHFIKSKTR